MPETSNDTDTDGDGDDGGTELEQCPVCEAVGLPERIEDHNFREFLGRGVRP